MSFLLLRGVLSYALWYDVYTLLMDREGFFVKEYTVDDFLTMRRDGTLEYIEQAVYLIKNLDKSMYYIGQSVHPHDRVFAHFVGRGNGDVYVDYRNGDSFIVRFYTGRT